MKNCHLKDGFLLSINHDLKEIYNIASPSGGALCTLAAGGAGG